MRKQAQAAAIIRVELVLSLLATFKRLSPKFQPVSLDLLRSWFVGHVERPFAVKAARANDPMYSNQVASGLTFIKNLLLRAEKDNLSLGKALELLRSSALSAAREAGLCHSRNGESSTVSSELREMCRDLLQNRL